MKQAPKAPNAEAFIEQQKQALIRKYGLEGDAQETMPAETEPVPATAVDALAPAA